ncbi:sorbosone dehydrogenase family protein [Paenibacillus sp. S150]|uniref:PQQ-dependent sugar dehydrogenase n=1 Tax=Paenibacillus sp. S150 TaxID=2749826 RepID=UPI001C567683|nr:PQQ-dependent sugar dehydrogenase [Paenibacillus sp. S150]MBW4083490.1 PQQ-dependent sugar dehydrogenase [Paenibacillus sp. S150]
MFLTKSPNRILLLGVTCILWAGLLTACGGSAGPESGEAGLNAGGALPAGTPAASAGPEAAASAGESSEGEGTAPGNPPPSFSSSSFPYTAQTLAAGLDVPWEMDFAPDGRIFFTERPGTLRVIENGEVRDNPLLEFPAPFLSRGEGGLLGFALDPAFEDNGFAYTYHSYRSESGGVENRVLRLSISGSKAVIDKVLLDGIPGDTNHNGGRIKFGPDGYLYITTGERYEPELAQDRNSLGGKILRISPDGSIPADNPFPGSPVYSWGHRNPQGLAWQPGSGILYSSEHGQSSHDEINIIEAGGNYGWPLIEGDEAGAGNGAGMKLPLLHSGEETWAPSGIAFITQGPWSGELLVANLAGQQLLHVSLGAGNGEAAAEAMFHEEWGRIRNVAEGPDGTLYLMTNNRDGRGSPGAEDDRLIALKPNVE